MDIFDKDKKFSDFKISDDIVKQLEKLEFKHPTKIQS